VRKHKAAAGFFPPSIVIKTPGATIGIVTLGGCDMAVREAIDRLPEYGIRADFLRVRGFPFDEIAETFLREHDVCFVVEQNRDAQLRALLLLETPVEKEKLRSVLVYGGFPLSAQHVIDGITSQMGVSTVAVHQ
jgi:2-oxoglutarate ferredoxin oxidoreductase subunit alpha